MEENNLRRFPKGNKSFRKDRETGCCSNYGSYKLDEFMALPNNTDVITHGMILNHRLTTPVTKSMKNFYLGK